MGFLLVRGGQVVNGGSRPTHADVLVEHDRVVGVAPNLEVPLGADILEADGLVVTPGFIDIHSHADGSLLDAPTAASAVRQGVTTVVVGNCGVGLAPVGPSGAFERVVPPGLPLSNVSWSSLPEYLARMNGLGVNVAVLVAHGPLRTAVTGGRPGPTTQVEQADMRHLLAEGLAAGAAGLSTGLEYPPGATACADEIEMLVRETARAGGLYATHVRERGDGFEEAVAEAIDVTARSGARLQLSHLAPRPFAPRTAAPAVADRIHVANAEGLRVLADTFPDTRGPDALLELLPPALTELPVEQLLQGLRSTDVRRDVREHFERRGGFLLRCGTPAEITITAHPCERSWVGWSLADVADALGATPADAACEVLLAAGEAPLAVGIAHPYARPEDLLALIRQPFTAFGSDGMVGEGEDAASTLPPNRSTYGYTARVLQEYVRERKLLTLPEAVDRLAQLPATALGRDDLGVIRPGAQADLVVFDPEIVSDRTTDRDQARHPTGLRHVIVRGTPVVRDGALTGARPGTLVS